MNLSKLETIYYNPAHPAGYAGPNKLYKVAQHLGYTHKQVNNWFKKQEVYSLTRPARHRFVRSQVRVNGLDDMWDADLIDMAFSAKENDNVHFILIVIDIFSRYVWTVALQTKTGPEVASAFETIFKNKRTPNIIRSDQGKEFLNKHVQAIYKMYNVKHFITYNEPKANYAEHVIKTIKMRVARYTLKQSNARYIDVLQNITQSYNNTHHHSIGTTPASVNKANEGEIRLAQYMLRQKYKSTHTKPFKVGDVVRISHVCKVFDKEYHQKWTGELFKVATVRFRDEHHVYTLKDWNDEVIMGTFYHYELQTFSVDANTVYKIEKVLKTRTYKCKKQVLVRWLHWPSKFNSWISKKELKTYTL